MRIWVKELMTLYKNCAYITDFCYHGDTENVSVVLGVTLHEVLAGTSIIRNVMYF